MSTWYQSKVKYGQMVDGKVKVVSENYLHDGVNFGEVETQCYEGLKTRIKDMNVDAIAKSTFGEVVFYKGTSDQSYQADPFYKVTIDTDGKSSYLIPASDAEQAIDRAMKAHGYGQRTNITEVKRTDVLAVWHPHNELWQGDWWNRMELLLELKKCSWDLNQTQMDFDSKPSNFRPDSETGIVLHNGIVDVDAEDLGNSDDARSEVLSPQLELPAGPGNLLGEPDDVSEPEEVEHE